MQRIYTKRLDLAFGAVFTIFYLGCVIVMAILDESSLMLFFNSLMHGIDVL